MNLERTAQVWGITGNLGGGKTLTAVEVAVQAMANGFFVCTNIDFKIDVLGSFLGQSFATGLYQRVDLDVDDPSSWPCGDPRGSGGSRRVLVILDEVAEWFDQYSGTSATVRRFLSWLRHSSKRGQDVFLVVQRKEYLAKSLRILVSRWVWVEDLAVWRIPHFKIRVPFCSSLIMRYVSDRLGNSIQPIEFSRKSKWGVFYTTSQLLAGSYGRVYDVPEDNRSWVPPLLPWLIVIGWALNRI